ncbi:hypothetical protein BGZ81_002478 [Podila clonocystis]|nr:hypothetical protein BGZ81_002478 [Podila clonocystis]
MPGMKEDYDLSTFDFAFVFQYIRGSDLVGVWANQSVLAATGNFKTLCHFPSATAGEPEKSLRTFTAEPLFPEHYALIHYLYIGEILTVIDVHHFVVTAMPVESPDKPQEKTYVMGDLAFAPQWNVSYGGLHRLAVRYKLEKLRALCAIHLKAAPKRR